MITKPKESLSLQKLNKTSTKLVNGIRISCNLLLCLLLSTLVITLSNSSIIFVYGQDNFYYTFVNKLGVAGNGTGQFDSPSGIAIDSSGNLYVVDAANNRIQKFSSNGQFLKTWGTRGSANGQFMNPLDIAIDPSGNVYVADTSNARIQKFSSNGQFLKTWGTRGSANGQFAWPTGVAVDRSGSVYVADEQNINIQKFTRDGKLIAKLSASYFKGGAPFSLDIDSSGSLYITDSVKNRIIKLANNGKFIAEFGKGQLAKAGAFSGGSFQPLYITTDTSGGVYVGDSSADRVVKFSGRDGRYLTEFGSRGSGDGEFNFPAGIAVSLKGNNIYAADSGNNRIQFFSATPSSPVPPPPDGRQNGEEVGVQWTKRR